VMYRGRIVHVTRAADSTQQELIKYMTGFSGQSGEEPQET
jgi:hypothetical protein